MHVKIGKAPGNKYHFFTFLCDLYRNKHSALFLQSVSWVFGLVVVEKYHMNIFLHYYILFISIGSCYVYLNVYDPLWLLLCFVKIYFLVIPKLCFEVKLCTKNIPHYNIFITPMHQWLQISFFLTESYCLLGWPHILW